MKRNLTCINCPLGCQITVDFEGNTVNEIVGNRCPRGKAFAEKEVTNPERTVTSTVRCEDGSLIAVRTSKAIPKALMFDVMAEINKAVAPLGVKMGQVIIENILGTGANVIATSEN